MKQRWWRDRERMVLSPSALSAWLERFHDRAEPKALAGTAFIPAVTGVMWRVNQALLGPMQQHQPARVATLDMDATLIETHEHDALHWYKGFKAYQWLNFWLAEQGAMLNSEFVTGMSQRGTSNLQVLRMGRSLLRAELGRAPPQADGIPVPGDPRTTAPTGIGRCGATAVPDAGVSQ